MKYDHRSHHKLATEKVVNTKPHAACNGVAPSSSEEASEALMVAAMTSPVLYPSAADWSAGFSAAAPTLRAGTAGLGAVKITLGTRTPVHRSFLVLKGLGALLLTFWLRMPSDTFKKPKLQWGLQPIGQPGRLEVRRVLGAK
jgi:hypothetical protein